VAGCLLKLLSVSGHKEDVSDKRKRTASTL